MLGFCCVIGETGLALAIVRAWRSHSGVAGWGWKGLAPRWDGTRPCYTDPSPSIGEDVAGGCGWLPPMPGSVVTVK